MYQISALITTAYWDILGGEIGPKHQSYILVIGWMHRRDCQFFLPDQFLQDISYSRCFYPFLLFQGPFINVLQRRWAFDPCAKGVQGCVCTGTSAQNKLGLWTDQSIKILLHSKQKKAWSLGKHVSYFGGALIGFYNYWILQNTFLLSVLWRIFLD